LSFCFGNCWSSGPAQHSRDFALFSVCSSCPSARCSSAADVVWGNFDIFETKTVFLNQIVLWFSLFIKILIVLNMNLWMFIFLAA
jgi:hypothetical protein